MTETDRFEALYRAHFDDLLSYAIRRVREPSDAADIVAETMTVAWRRRADLPPNDEQRLWLFGVARNILANQRRREVRRSQLAKRLRDELEHHQQQNEPADDSPVLAALRRLSIKDQDLLGLHAWEGLRPEEIAVVLGCTPVAARVRLHRARQRLRNALDTPEGDTALPAGLTAREAT